MKKSELSRPLVDLGDDALVRSLADRPYLIEATLIDHVMSTLAPEELDDDIAVAAAIWWEISSYDEREDEDEAPYGSALDELFETGVISIDAIVEEVRELRSYEAA